MTFIFLAPKRTISMFVGFNVFVLIPQNDYTALTEIYQFTKHDKCLDIYKIPAKVFLALKTCICVPKYEF